MDIKEYIVNFDKINIFFCQFEFLNAIRFLCAELARKVFDPYNVSSYAQTGEDLIITSILGKTGFYVDVGCNHPKVFSNTFVLYKCGWTGITIDANKELIQKNQKLRKQDTSICAVVSDKKQEVAFTDFEDSLVSSLNTEVINHWQKTLKIKEQRIVNTVLLSTILDSHEVPKNFDLLSIDVEGHDFEVLSSLNLNIYRPKLIVIEMLEFDLLNPSSNKIYEYLRVNNYKMISYVIWNGYFLDSSTTDYLAEVPYWAKRQLQGSQGKR